MTAALKPDIDALIERLRKYRGPWLVPEEAAAALESLREERDRYKRLDAEAAEHVETFVVMRAPFTGEPPYVGWKGIGQAIREVYAERDAAREALRIYGRHGRNDTNVMCEHMKHSEYPCTCGFDAALAAKEPKHD